MDRSLKKRGNAVAAVAVELSLASRWRTDRAARAVRAARETLERATEAVDRAFEVADDAIVAAAEATREYERALVLAQSSR